MKVVLPIQKKEIENDKLKVVKDELELDLDLTLRSQMRFEIKFPELAQKEDLVSYTDRIRQYSFSVGKVLSILKAVYCWFDTDIPFIDFIGLFDFTDQEYVEKLLNVFDKIFKIIFESSAEKN